MCGLVYREPRFDCSFEIKKFDFGVMTNVFYWDETVNDINKRLNVSQIKKVPINGSIHRVRKFLPEYLSIT